MKNNIVYSFLFFHLSLFCQPTIVMLMGSGSAGKTSIGKALQSIDSHWAIIDEDIIYRELFFEKVAEIFPEELATIEKVIAPYNRFHAIQRNEFVFYESVDTVLRAEAEKAIKIIQDYCYFGAQAKIFRELFYKEFQDRTIRIIDKAVKENKNVLLDSWYITSEKVQETFANACVMKTLVFCSLSSTYEHFKKRNRDALLSNNIDNKRCYQQLIPHYVSLYRATTTSTKKAIAKSNKQEIEAIFDHIGNELPKSVVLREMTVDELNELRREFIPQDLSDENVFTESKNEYDMLLNTDVMTAEDAARFLLGSIKSH